MKSEPARDRPWEPRHNVKGLSSGPPRSHAWHRSGISSSRTSFDIREASEIDQMAFTPSGPAEGREVRDRAVAAGEFRLSQTLVENAKRVWAKPRCWNQRGVRRCGDQADQKRPPQDPDRSRSSCPSPISARIRPSRARLNPHSSNTRTAPQPNKCPLSIARPDLEGILPRFFRRPSGPLTNRIK